MAETDCQRQSISQEFFGAQERVTGSPKRGKPQNVIRPLWPNLRGVYDTAKSQHNPADTKSAGLSFEVTPLSPSYIRQSLHFFSATASFSTE
jgi:hypothetical protein